MPELLNPVIPPGVTVPVVSEPTVSAPPGSAAALVARVAASPPPAMTPSPDTAPALELADVGLTPESLAKLPAEQQAWWTTFQKNANAGLTKKFMTLAESRKAAEAKLAEAQTVMAQPWTPERVLDLSKNPNFVEAARHALASTAPPSWDGTSEQWSALSDSDKRAFTQLQGEVQTLRSDAAQARHQAEHTLVKSRFADYDAAQVDAFQADLFAGKVTNERAKELVWKALNFDRYVENSYQFGLKDRHGTLQEKLAGSSAAPSPSVVTAADKPVAKDGETGREYFKRLANWNLARLRLQGAAR